LRCDRQLECRSRCRSSERHRRPTLPNHPTLFPEGKPLYPTAGFRELTHIQLCVRDSRQIQGVFRIPDEQRTTLGLPRLYDL
jgi:hypothetical protein